MASPSIPMRNCELTTTQLEELLRIVEVYDAEAERCEEAGAYLAACMMLAAELEAVLLATASTRFEDVLESPACPQHRDDPKPLIDWSLSELLGVARDLHWLPYEWSINADTERQPLRADDQGDLLRRVRNLIHPARYIQDIPGGHVTEAELEICYRVVEDVIIHLGRPPG